MSTCQIPKLNDRGESSILPPVMADKQSLSEIDKKRVGRRIVAIRKVRKLQQKRLADVLETTPQKLNNYEKGRDMLPVPLAHRLCALTGANFDYLYRGIIAQPLHPDFATALTMAELAEEGPARPRTRRRGQ